MAWNNKTTTTTTAIAKSIEKSMASINFDVSSMDFNLSENQEQRERETE